MKPCDTPVQYQSLRGGISQEEQNLEGYSRKEISFKNLVCEVKENETYGIPKSLMGILFQYCFAVESAYRKKNLQAHIDCIDSKAHMITQEKKSPLQISYRKSTENEIYGIPKSLVIWLRSGIGQQEKSLWGFIDCID